MSTERSEDLRILTRPAEKANRCAFPRGRNYGSFQENKMNESQLEREIRFGKQARNVYRLAEHITQIIEDVRDGEAIPEDVTKLDDLMNRLAHEVDLVKVEIT